MKNVSKKPFLALIVMIVFTALTLSLAGCGPGQSKGSADGAAQEPAQEEPGEAQDPEAKDPLEEARDNKQEAQKVNTDNITINTQSSIRIEGSKTIYIDPYKRTEAPHDADLILITHAHYDHFDEPSLRNVCGEKTFIICPDSMNVEVEHLDLKEKGRFAVGPDTVTKNMEGLEGITIEAVPAYNLNKNFHPKANGWVGYVIKMDGITYYAAGDTDALPELEGVKCDIAFVPVGGTYTMTAKEAAGLINKIKPEIAVPIHYGTIVGTAADADTFKAAVNSGIKVVTKVEDAK